MPHDPEFLNSATSPLRDSKAQNCIAPANTFLHSSQMLRPLGMTPPKPSCGCQHSTAEAFYGGYLGPPIPADERFRLDAAFVNKFRDQRPPFGFNGLGEVVYLRTYARTKDNGESEMWVDTVERVVQGTFEILQHHIVNRLGCPWDMEQAKVQAEDMFDRIFHMKFLPPGRGLWAMGSPLVTKKGMAAALNNCAFVSTSNLAAHPTQPFTFLMDASMLGIGVGFDTAGAGSFIIPGPDRTLPLISYIVPDSREGWVESVHLLLDAFLNGKADVTFDYSQVRPLGVPLKTFGGISSGPEPLITLHQQLRQVLTGGLGKPITVSCITDMMNMIGVCVVAGNVRRSAEIAFGDPNSDEFLNLKNYAKNPHRQEYGWASNNSIFATLGMDYSEVCKLVLANGEPGFAWLENMKAFSRMSGVADYRDCRVQGGNPCLEQSLESMELCCLVETFPAVHSTLEDFQNTLKSALLYAKVVTLLPVHWPESNQIMSRNRRIGCSVSGIAQFITDRSLHELRSWLEAGYQTLQDYDCHISEWLCVRQSIKLTSVKPSGTVSLVAGATPGVHYPEASYYIRRLRMPNTSPLLLRLAAAGYHIESCAMSPDFTSVVEFPVAAGTGTRTTRDVSMWEQLSLAAFMQEHWADNQVSATVTFDPDTEGPQIANALNYFQYRLKGISFLPRLPSGAYPQMPYEAISEEQYNEAIQKIKWDVPLSSQHCPLETAPSARQTFCDNDRCTLDL